VHHGCCPRVHGDKTDGVVCTSATKTALLVVGSSVPRK
jgi:hypothetical protein